jgi:hypothetical protein
MPFGPIEERRKLLTPQAAKMLDYKNEIIWKKNYFVGFSVFDSLLCH